MLCVIRTTPSAPDVSTSAYIDFIFHFSLKKMIQSMEGALAFIFPPSRKHPESLGRLELLALCGPVEGGMIGGRAGMHRLTDLEISLMIKDHVKQELQRLLGKDREVVVAELLTEAMRVKTDRTEIEAILGSVKKARDGVAIDFGSIQDKVLSRMDKRLRNLTLIADTEPLTRLKAVYTHAQTPQMARKEGAGQIKGRIQYLLHTRTFEVMSIDDKPKVDSLVANVTLARPLTLPDDQWDRSCCVRNTGRASYVKSQ
jgi:hypothetical protein